MTPVDLAAWRIRNGLSNLAAAEALGISERSMRNYQKPGATVPKVVKLAVQGWEAERGATRAPAEFAGPGSVDDFLRGAARAYRAVHGGN